MLSPKIAATHRTRNTKAILKVPTPAKAPAANKSVSPGKKGAMTSPVSQKIIANNINQLHWEKISDNRYK